MRILSLLLLVSLLLWVPASLIAASPDNSALFPEFSWERVPRYMHIRKDKAFTPEEIRYLATFPLLTFEKTTGVADFGSTEAGTLAAARAVKKINPATKVLFYRNVILHYGGYAADASLANVPDAFLVGRGGSDKLVRGRVQAYDLSNPKVRDWWVAIAKKVCDDPAIDGLFLDGNVKALEPAYLLAEIGAEKKAAVINGYTLMMEEARRALGPDKLMLANVLRARFPDSGLSRLAAFDGSYIEAFDTTVGKVPLKDYVAKGIAAFQEAARQGFIIAFTAGADLGEEGGQAEKTKEQRTDEILQSPTHGQTANSKFQYLLAIFLICAEEHSYFYVHEGYKSLQMNHPPEFDRRLGAPKGPATRKGYIYTREFAHASVRLDLESQTAEIKWK